METETKLDRSSRRSLKVRATAFTLAIFVLGISALSIFVSRSLQADMEQLLGEQQFSVVTSVARNVNDDLTERLQDLQTVAKEMDSAMLARPTALQARLEQRPPCCNCCSTAGFLSPGWTKYRLHLSPSPLKAQRVLASITVAGTS